MKRFNPTSLTLLALAVFSTGVVFGQADKLPVSRTAGIIDVPLPVNQLSLMALPLVEIVASGTVSSTAAGVHTLTSFPAVLPTDLATSPHAIKITSRVDQRGTGTNAPAGSSTNAYGLSARITAAASQTVTAALQTAPNVGDEFIIYRLETLSTIFGATNTAGLRSGSTSATSDIVYVDDGAGDLKAYFYRSTASAWRLVSAPSGADQNAVVVPPNRGLIVARKSGGNAVTIRISGDEMVGTDSADVVNSGFSVVNNPWTVSTTLDGSGLKNFVAGGSTAASADTVYLESGGVLTAYFYRSSVSQWRLVSAPSGANQGAALVSAGKAILFGKKALANEFVLQQPFAE